jgi:pSer/pThr/pTyr-binding forkhead associated (FHA) protein
MSPQAPEESRPADARGSLASSNAALARLVLPDGQEWPLAGEALGIGRRVGNHILVDDPQVSGEHAKIVHIGDDHVLLDLRSSNGTYVNGQRIVDLHLLRDGDLIEVAGRRFLYRGVPAVSSPAATAPPAAASGDQEVDVELGVLLLKEILVGKAGLRIGRAADNDLVLDDSRVSGQHAKVVREGQDYYLLDLGSSNGTFVNGQRVPDVHRLREGDAIMIAGTPLTFVRRTIRVRAEDEPHVEHAPSFVFADATGRRWKRVRLLAAVSIVLWIISLVLFIRFVLQ